MYTFGATTIETIELANLGAVITVQKLFQTGSANENEILAIVENFF